MKNYKTILAGEVRRRKYFRKRAKVYRRELLCCRKELFQLRRDYDFLRREYDDLKRNFKYRLEREVKELVAAEKFSIEYRYCEQIDLLEAKLAIYEMAHESDDDDTAAMVLTADQCKRLDADLSRLKGIVCKYDEACKQLESIRKIVNNAI